MKKTELLTVNGETHQYEYMEYKSINEATNALGAKVVLHFINSESKARAKANKYMEVVAFPTKEKEL